MAIIKTTVHSIYISSHVANELNTFLGKNVYSKLFVLVDENSFKHCYPQLVAEVKMLEDAEIIEIESGEENKNIDICSQLWAVLAEYKADKKSLLINLGGGVITDMGGFLASAYKRGIDFINIPTTLLAQVDASVGGKVGVDLNNIKNAIGLYRNPQAVFIDSSFLTTLDKRQLKSGFAEIIKHALIADSNYWKKIKKADTVNFNGIDGLIKTSVQIKTTIVEQDPFEKNIRKSLNFGHTVGHAIESYFLEKHPNNYLLHGEAIAVGMICEAYISNKILKLSDKDLLEITTFIKSIYKKVSIEKADFTAITELMHHDKKNEHKQINFSLLPSIGTCKINQVAPESLIHEALEYYTKA